MTAGSRIEMPGFSLCMGNQAQVKDNTSVFSTSTRNFNNSLSNGAKVQLGSTEDWLLVNDDVMDHPFHLHVNAFQVISRAGRPESQRRWKDTVLVKAGEEVRIRVTFRNFTGRTVYRCHNLDHEDLGLMGVTQIDAQAG